ncbi:MAG: hypothetical protein JJE34_05225 [Alphaproteobacteria bacterium]|nr:hypothetical protein [Alphaproteobacteria bacterium]
MKCAVLFLALALAVPAPAHARESLGVYERWGAFHDAEMPRCFAISQPVNGNRELRWRPFAAIGFWPKKGLRGQVHFRISHEKALDAEITLSIGERRFTLIAGGADAWAPDKRVDAAIIAAIRSGNSMSVQTVAKNGAPFTDVYALRGAASAIDAAALGCVRSD